MAVVFLENTFDSKNCPALDLSGVNFEKTDFLEGNLKNTDFSNSYFQCACGYFSFRYFKTGDGTILEIFAPNATISFIWEERRMI